MILLNRPSEFGDKKHRAAPRLPFSPDIPCQVFDSPTGQQWPAWVRDISTSGISLLLEPQLQIGAIIIVEMRLPGDNRFLRKQAEVRHSEICFPNNAYLHGCSFLEPVSEEELAQVSWPINERVTKH
jgi:hypothetical protein